MSKSRIFIDGHAGTTGLQIREVLQRCKQVTVLEISEEDRKRDAVRRELLNEADVAILCLPDAAARQAVSWIENESVRILDASSAHRVTPGWVYGFPEVWPGQARSIAEASRVSNPGCYPSGVIAVLSPLIQHGLLPASLPVTVNAISGYSGGGRQMIERYESSKDYLPAYQPYALELEHKHVAEMTKYCGLEHAPLCVPAVGTFGQGTLTQVPIQLWALDGAPSPEDLHAVLANHYADAPAVRVAPLVVGAVANAVTLDPEKFNHTNQMEIYVFGNAAARQVVLMACYDNLGKGASGAAMQNLKLMLDF